MANVKFKSFSSGSCGNCYFLGLFSDEGQCEAGILIDAGVSPRRVRKFLSSEGIGLDDLNAMLITHNHFDHVRSLGSHCRHTCKPVWATPTLHRVLAGHTSTCEITGYRKELEEGWNEIVPGRIRARYFEVPHDAAQTVGYAICLDGYNFVIMTDIGRMTQQAMALAKQAHTVVIESNYDPYMLEHGPYPKDLQDRIRDGHGHLSNFQCAEAIKEFAHEGLKNVFMCHLSEHNNTPKLAMDTAFEILGGRPDFRLAPLPRTEPSPMMNL